MGFGSEAATNLVVDMGADAAVFFSDWAKGVVACASAAVAEGLPWFDIKLNLILI